MRYGCPSCSGAVTLHAGERKARHFHHRRSACSVETVLHVSAKRLIVQAVEAWKAGGPAPVFVRACAEPGCGARAPADPAPRPVPALAVRGARRAPRRGEARGAVRAPDAQRARARASVPARGLSRVRAGGGPGLRGDAPEDARRARVPARMGERVHSLRREAHVGASATMNPATPAAPSSGARRFPADAASRARAASDRRQRYGPRARRSPGARSRTPRAGAARRARRG